MAEPYIYTIHIIIIFSSLTHVNNVIPSMWVICCISFVGIVNDLIISLGFWFLLFAIDFWCVVLIWRYIVASFTSNWAVHNSLSLPFFLSLALRQKFGTHLTRSCYFGINTFSFFKRNVVIGHCDEFHFCWYFVVV